MWNCGTCWIDAQRLQEITLFYLRGAVSSVWAVRKPCAGTDDREARQAARPAAAAHGREEDRGKLLHIGVSTRLVFNLRRYN